MIVLETALPAKFADDHRRGARRASPSGRRRRRGIEALPRRCTVMAADASAVKRFIETHVA